MVLDGDTGRFSFSGEESTRRHRQPVRFLPSGYVAANVDGSTVLETAAAAGLTIEAPCGGRKRCGKCRVAFTAGAPVPTPLDHALLTAADLAAGVRLACRARLQGGEVVQLLPPPRIDWWKITAVDPAAGTPDPNVRVVRCLLPNSGSEQPTAYATLLRQQLGEVHFPLVALQHLAKRAMANDTAVPLQVVLIGDEVAEVQLGTTLAGDVYGLALDIGTTTIVGYLLDLQTGRQVAAASAMNPQVTFGADLISRLHAVREEPTAAVRLRDLVVAAVQRILMRCCRQASCAPERVFEVSVAANTCMHHLFLGIDPASLATAPFVPVVTEALNLPATEVGLAIHPRGHIYLLPNIAGFVGADTLAGIIASGIAHDDAWRLLIDIGTNAELVLGHRGQLFACSAAAGPAFEGGNISCGTVARAGAVSRVVWEQGRLRAETIGGEPAVGLCGAGLLDAVAVLRAHDVVRPDGRLEPSERLAPAVRDGLQWSDTPPGVLVAAGERPVVLSQRDVRELQLAKGAIRAACEVLLHVAGIEITQVEEVLLAGAFGNYVDPSSAVALGLIPPLPADQVRSIGNAAGTGARLALLQCGVRDEVAALREHIQYVALAVHPGFQDAFVDGMRLGSDTRTEG